MAEAWMTMVFRHGFFHGDPHPANVLVMPEGDVIGLVDFGAIGRLTDEDMSRLTRLFLDAVNENIEALPRRLHDLGVRYPREREAEFVAELRELFYRYYGGSLAEVDPLQVIREAFGLIYSLNLELPTRFVLLDRVVATLAPVGVELYPDFNVFEIARPYARDLMIRGSPRSASPQDARREAWQLAGIVHEMPYQIHDVLEELRDGQMEVGIKLKSLDELLGRLDVLINRLVLAIVVVGGLLGSSIMVALADAGPTSRA